MNRVLLIKGESFFEKKEDKWMNRAGILNVLYKFNSFGFEMYILKSKEDKRIDSFANFIQNEGLSFELITEEILNNILIKNQLEKCSQVISIDFQFELNNPNYKCIRFSNDSDVVENYSTIQKRISIQSWKELATWIEIINGEATLIRKSNETQISASLLLNSSGKSKIETGIPFFDHMLEQIAKHAGCQLFFNAIGDLQVDEHHTIEDSALVLGSLFKQTLGNKAGIERYGFCLPMDDVIVISAIDFGGRPWLNWDVGFNRNDVGGIPTEMFYHFFKSFSDAAQCNVYIQAKGENTHHLIEGIFKSFAKSIKNAIRREAFNFEIPSTKGIL